MSSPSAVMLGAILCCGSGSGGVAGHAIVQDGSGLQAQVSPAATACGAVSPKSGGTEDGSSMRPRAGRAHENVIRQAEDAFGTSIGRESIGIYSAGNVRGFSAIEAGNARIDGLYFDQIAGPSPRIRRSTSVRVGLSALAFPFPAPTGVVDYALIRPGPATSLSATLSADSDENVGLDIDFSLPLADDRLVLGGGAGLARQRFVNGATRVQTVAGLTALWKPIESIELRPLWTRTDTYDNRIGPNFATASGDLPPPIPRRRFLGQDWAQFDGAALLYGLILRARPADRWLIEAGVFRSAYLTKRDAFVLFSDLQPDGSGRYLIFTDPPGHTASTSGEARLTYRSAGGPRVHRLIASARARDRDQLLGGSDGRDYGLVEVGDVPALPRPDFVFGAQTVDRIRQLSAGLTYHVRWEGLGELSAGVSRTDYRRRIERPEPPLARVAVSSWLYGGTAAIEPIEGFVLYAGYTRGLEDSGVAPQNATNRNEALPAIATSQRDGGIRWAITEGLRLVGAIFDVRKPYFGRNATGAYVQLGRTRNRGVELSLTGQATRTLEIVVGAVLLDPRVTGEAVASGEVGQRPVGLPRRLLDASFDWTTPLRGVSLDLRVVHRSARPATALNSAFLPSRTLVDLGGRYRFRIGSSEGTLRLSVSNLGDVRGYELRGEGTYDLIDGRIVSAYLTMDL